MKTTMQRDQVTERIEIVVKKKSRRRIEQAGEGRRWREGGGI